MMGSNSALTDTSVNLVECQRFCSQNLSSNGTKSIASLSSAIVQLTLVHILTCFTCVPPSGDVYDIGIPIMHTHFGTTVPKKSRSISVFSGAGAFLALPPTAAERFSTLLSIEAGPMHPEKVLVLGSLTC